MKVSIERELRSPQDWIEFWSSEVQAGRMAETVATDKFGLFMTRGLKVKMTDGHATAKRVWDTVVNMETSDNEEVTEYAGLGEVTGVAKVLEKEQIPEGEFSHDRTSIVNSKYGMALRFSAEMIRRDRSGKIPGQASKIGAAFQDYKDNHYAVNWFNTAKAIYDGGNFLTTNHPNVTGGPAVGANDNSLSLGAISVANVDTARQTVAGWQRYDGHPVNATIGKWIVASNQFENTVRYIASAAHPVVDFSAGVVNPHAGTPVQEWTRLTASTWYGQTGIPGLTHQTEVPFTTDRENQQSGDAFWREIMLAVKGTETWGSGCLNWRSHFKGN